jgi:predicted acyltransferase (DUF342 family)
MALSNKLVNILAVPFIALLLSVVLAKPANAAEFHFTDYTLEKEQTVNNNVYVFTTDSQVNGVIQGDLLVFAENVNISGAVTGDVYAFGSNITFTGNVYGNFFAFGNNENIKGNISGNLYTIGNTVNYDGQVGRDLTNISMQGNISGTIMDDIRVVAQQANIDADIKGEATVIAQKYTIDKEKVSGEIYDSETIKSIAKDQGVDLSKTEETKTDYTTTWTDKLLFALFGYVSMGLVGYILISVTPVKTGRVITKITENPKEFILSFLVGFLALILAPAALVLLTLSLVGIPLGILVFGILMFLVMFGGLWVEVGIGQEILSLFKVNGYRPFKSLAVGRLLTVLISLIPVVGAIYICVLASTATGAFLRMKKEYLDMAKKK